MYSASAVESDTQFYFLLNHEIKLFPGKKHPLKVLFLLSEHPTQSESQYPTRMEFVSYEYRIPKSLVPWTFNNSFDCS